MERTRLFLTTKDVQVLIDRSERTARNLMKKIRIVFNKEPHQPITVSDFSIYMDVPEEDVQRILSEWRK